MCMFYSVTAVAAQGLRSEIAFELVFLSQISLSMLLPFKAHAYQNYLVLFGNTD
jgi:hypothetical protein